MLHCGHGTLESHRQHRHIKKKPSPSTFKPKRLKPTVQPKQSPSPPCLFCKPWPEESYGQNPLPSRMRNNLSTLVQRALYSKYSPDQNHYFTKMFNDLINARRTPGVILLKEKLAVVDDHGKEYLKAYTIVSEGYARLEMMAEYYKYHSEVPRFFMLPQAGIYVRGIDLKRKLLYRRVAKLLNLPPKDLTTASRSHEKKSSGRDDSQQHKGCEGLKLLDEIVFSNETQELKALSSVQELSPTFQAHQTTEVNNDRPEDFLPTSSHPDNSSVRHMNEDCPVFITEGSHHNISNLSGFLAYLGDEKCKSTSDSERKIQETNEIVQAKVEQDPPLSLKPKPEPKRVEHSRSHSQVEVFKKTVAEPRILETEHKESKPKQMTCSTRQINDKSCARSVSSFYLKKKAERGRSATFLSTAHFHERASSDRNTYGSPIIHGISQSLTNHILASIINRQKEVRNEPRFRLKLPSRAQPQTRAKPSLLVQSPILSANKENQSNPKRVSVSSFQVDNGVRRKPNGRSQSRTVLSNLSQQKVGSQTMRGSALEKATSQNCSSPLVTKREIINKSRPETPSMIKYKRTLSVKTGLNVEGSLSVRPQLTKDPSLKTQKSSKQISFK